LEYRGDGVVAATIEASSPIRQLVFTNTATTLPTTMPVGRMVVTARVRPGANDVTAGAARRAA
jgi:hypothetical protein